MNKETQGNTQQQPPEGRKLPGIGSQGHHRRFERSAMGFQWILSRVLTITMTNIRRRST